MPYTIVECSPQARAKIKPNDGAEVPAAEPNEHHRTKYPTDALKVGQSFTVPISEANEMSLRITASKRGKDTGKKFCVIKHADYQCFEVARIA